MSNKRILISPDNKFWTYDNKIVTDAPFNTIPLPEGLTFWSSSEVENLEIIDGLVRTAYDIRDTDKNWSLFMRQDTEANRPSYNNGVINTTALQRLSAANQKINSMFVVIKRSGGGTSGIGLDTNNGISWQGDSPVFYKLNNAFLGINTFFVNATKNASITVSVTNQFYVLHTLADFNKLNNTIVVGNTTTGTGIAEILEWGWYNRVLTEKEVLSNVNAMNEKYKIFV